MTKQTSHIKPQTHKERTATLAQDLTLNSDAAPNYKYMFVPHMGPLPLSVKCHCKTHVIKHYVMKLSKGLNDDLKPELCF